MPHSTALAQESARASPTTATVLSGLCASAAGVGGRAYSPCAAYILGAFDQLAIRKEACLPEGARIEQVVSVVVKALEADPDSHQHAASLVSATLSRSFPCPKQE